MRSPRAGVTLLELLVALALLALIAVGLANTMGLGARVWEQSQGLASAEEEIVLRSRLRTWLGQTAAPSRLLPFEHGFAGSGTGFSFLTLAETPHEPGAAALRVTVEAGAELTVLRLDYLDDGGAVIRRDERVLVAGDVRLGYFDPMDGSWVTEWDNEFVLPALIRMETIDPNRNWPLFVAETGLL